MTKLFTSVVAVAIGAVWIVGPAAAQTTSDKVKNKAERAEDKIEDKAERAKDKTESKTESTMDKVKEKARDAKDKMVETKDKVVDKMKGSKDRAKVTTRAEDRNVRAAQQALRDQGYNPGPIDGVMGPRTSAAVRDYQAKQGLTASGQLDDATMDKLGVRGASSASPTTEPQTTAPGAQKSKQTP